MIEIIGTLIVAAVACIFGLLLFALPIFLIIVVVMTALGAINSVLIGK